MDHLLNTGESLVGRYRIESYLNAGGMQQVYVAKDLAFNRDVALKVPTVDSGRRRFDRSARVSAKINHPNVAKTLDYFEEDGESYLVEELVDGIDLGRFLERFDPLDPHLAAHILHHLARGLAASHHVDVIHRDLKPSNILVSRDTAASTVKITDFGIAKLAEGEIGEALAGGEDSITASKTALGALPYMAPEMIERSKDATTAVDVWALGALTYRILSGQPPFGSGLKAVASILAAKTPPRPAIWDHNQSFEPLLTELWNIVVTCLSRDPANRPTADELAVQCAELGYCNAERLEGMIETYPINKWRYGFIRGSNGEEIFFHKQSFFSDVAPAEGMRVVFGAYPGSPRRRAYPVLPRKV